MRTATKIVALHGAGATSNAFFTEFFNSDEVQVTAQNTQKFESMYDAQDFVYYNWYYGNAMPVYGSNYDYGYFTGPYGGDAFGFYSYDFYGYIWNYNGGMMSYGWYGYIYSDDYDYLYLAFYVNNDSGLFGYDFYGYYFMAGQYDYNWLYYLNYNDYGFLGVAYYLYGGYGYGTYYDMMAMYYYGYYYAMYTR